MEQHQFPLLDTQCTVEVLGEKLRGRCQSGPLGDAPIGSPGWNFESFEDPNNVAATLKTLGEVDVNITLVDIKSKPDGYPIYWTAKAKLVYWDGQEYLASENSPKPVIQ